MVHKKTADPLVDLVLTMDLQFKRPDSLLQLVHGNLQKKILPHGKDFSILVTVSFTHAAHYKADDEY